MYVYLVKFEKQPNLVKIGKSTTPKERFAQLSRTHGKVVFEQVYQIGKSYSVLERLLHKQFSDKRERIEGEGGTEFFCVSVIEEAIQALSVYKPKKTPSYDLYTEDLRMHNLIGHLLGYKYSSLYTGTNSMFTGWLDIVKITGAIDLGFSEDEVCRKFISSDKELPRPTRFTTPERVAMAIRLAKGGSKKYQTLKAEYLVETLGHTND